VFGAHVAAVVCAASGCRVLPANRAGRAAPSITSVKQSGLLAVVQSAGERSHGGLELVERFRCTACLVRFYQSITGRSQRANHWRRIVVVARAMDLGREAASCAVALAELSPRFLKPGYPGSCARLRARLAPLATGGVGFISFGVSVRSAATLAGCSLLSSGPVCAALTPARVRRLRAAARACRDALARRRER